MANSIVVWGQWGCILMGTEDIKVIWGVVASAAGGLFFFIKWGWGEWAKLKRSRELPPKPESVDPDKPHYVNANHNMIRLYKQLTKLQVYIGAGQITLCRSHNGGEIPNIKGAMYVSSMYDVSSHIAPGSGWDSVKMDLQYHTMMEDLYLHKTLIVSVDDAEPGIFKYGMGTVNAKTGAFAEVLMTPKEYYFIAAVFLKQPNELDEIVDYYLRIAATNLAKILKACPALREYR